MACPAHKGCVECSLEQYGVYTIYRRGYTELFPRPQGGPTTRHTTPITAGPRRRRNFKELLLLYLRCTQRRTRFALPGLPTPQFRAKTNKLKWRQHLERSKHILKFNDSIQHTSHITSRLFIHVAAAAYRGGVVQWLHARDTPLIAADNDEWQQWRSKAAAGAISDHKTSRVWVQPAASIFNPTVSNPPSASKSSITVLVKLTRSGTDSPSTEAALFPSLLPPPAVPAVVASTLKPESLG